MSVTNSVCWVDIPVTNLERARDFYQAVYNQPIEIINEGGWVFALLPHVQDSVAGCLCEMPNRKPTQDGALVYLNVDGRLDLAIEAVKKAGGKILEEKSQIGPYGFRAIVLDTEGNSIALYSSKA